MLVVFSYQPMPSSSSPPHKVQTSRRTLQQPKVQVWHYTTRPWLAAGILLVQMGMLSSFVLPVIAFLAGLLYGVRIKVSENANAATHARP